MQELVNKTIESTEKWLQGTKTALRNETKEMPRTILRETMELKQNAEKEYGL